MDKIAGTLPEAKVVGPPPTTARDSDETIAELIRFFTEVHEETGLLSEQFQSF